MTIDPNDDKTFWSIGEVFYGGTRKNQVGVFKIASDLATDVGIVSVDSPEDGTLTSSETITVTIRNFGIDTQTSIPVGFQINGETIINETFNGSLSGSTNEQYTFTATGDFSNAGETYEIKAFTSLGSDMDPDNDMIIAMVTHIHPNDIGIAEINSPVSGSNLGPNESIEVTIENFGGDPQTDFDVSYTLDGGDPVTEQISGTLNSMESMNYMFAATGDFSALGDHELSITTSLPGDADISNDELAVTITKFICLPTADCTLGDGIKVLQLAEVDNNSGCDPDGYGNYLDLIATMAQGSSNDLTITTEYGSQHVRVWIDFNDDFAFETDEIVVNDYVIADGQNSGTFTEIIPLEIPADAPIGEHMMRAKTNWNSPVPDDPCESTTYGETEDYTANIVLETGITQNYEPNEMIISSLENNHFAISFTSVNQTEPLTISVHNMLGHTLIENKVLNVNGKYLYDFDMSYSKPGVYIVRLGSSSFGKVKRIVVK